MVHSDDTPVALRAMVRSRRFDRLAGGASLHEFFSDQLHLTDLESAHFANFNVLFAIRLRVRYQAFRLDHDSVR